MNVATRLRMGAAGAPRSSTAVPLAYSPSWYFPNTYVTDKDSGTARTRRIARFAQGSMRPCFAGFSQVGDIGNAYTIVAAYIEYLSTLYQILFGGSASKVVNPGDWVESDIVAGLGMPDDAVYHVRTHITVASLGLQLPLGQINGGATYGEGSNYGVGATNRANTTGTTNLATTNGYLFGPVTVLGVPA
jgi:hypothetical protein